LDIFIFLQPNFDLLDAFDRVRDKCNSLVGILAVFVLESGQILVGAELEGKEKGHQDVAEEDYWAVHVHENDCTDQDVEGDDDQVGELPRSIAEHHDIFG